MIINRNPKLLQYKDILTRKFLEQEYILKKKSMMRLSRELNKDQATIKYYLLFHNIKLRSHKEQANISSPGGKYKYDNVLTKKFLTKEYIENKKGIKHLAKELNLDWGTVKRYLVKYGINIRTAKEQINLSYPPKEFLITNEIKSFIDGILLGDASIPKRTNGVPPRLLNQACKHREYLEYISKRLSNSDILCSPVLSRWINDERCKNEGYDQSFLQTRHYKTFELFRERWYKEGKKVLPKDFKLSKDLLLQSYLCDGNFYREIRLCLDAFDKGSILFLKQLIEKELKIIPRIVKMKNNQFELAIKKSDTSKFLEYIGECPVECYKYKWKNNESEEARKRKNLNARLSYYRRKMGKKYVIHDHKSKKPHFDLRLEMDGVLKSWAVPKEPSKTEKRLAIQVQDHDLSYAKFEGEIPEGSYGAGKVKIWDKGTYEMLEKKKGKYLFKLKGKKLKGTWVLFKFEKAGPKNWLLFKKKEEKK